LQTQGIEVLAEMDFLGQQNIMLDLENKSLKQRLESLSQEHVIKRGEFVYAVVASIIVFLTDL
jgi:regulator of replication initiation timing